MERGGFSGRGLGGVVLAKISSSPNQAKSCLKTVEGIGRRMSPEQNNKRLRNKLTKRDPGGLP